MYSEEKKNAVRDAVAKSKSIAGVLREMGMRPCGGNYETVKRHIKELGLNTEHFTGQGHMKGKKSFLAQAAPLSQILVENSGYRHGSRLLKRLVSEGIFERTCMGCRLSEWMGGPIPLELDHINGKRSDNRIENLRALCPNCHALTDTYRGRNIKVEKKKYSCSECGSEISPNSKSGMCVSCVKKTPKALEAREARFKTGKEDRERAKEMMFEGISCSEVARRMGVSRPTIKRWTGA